MRRMSLTPELVALCHREEADPGPDPNWTQLNDEDFRSLALRLSDEADEGPLWVFAYGSLIWKPEFESRITAYFEKLAETAATGSGFDGWVRLAESRRREFRGRRLAEFRLTTPTTNIPDSAPLLEMTIEGGVIEKSTN